MAFHTISLSYPEKIAAVKEGKCDQTIRQLRVSPKTKKLNLKEYKDPCLIHTWAGVPRHSKWDWRFYTALKEVITLQRIFDRWWMLDGSRFEVGSDLRPVSIGGVKLRMGEDDLEAIIRRDWIQPATVDNFQQVLMKLNGLKDLECTYWQVCRFYTPDQMRSGIR